MPSCSLAAVRESSSQYCLASIIRERLERSTVRWDQAKDPWASAPPAADGHKVVLLDTDHIGWKIFIHDAAFTRAWVWKRFTRGYSTLLMENLSPSVLFGLSLSRDRLRLAILGCHPPPWGQVLAQPGKVDACLPYRRHSCRQGIRLWDGWMDRTAGWNVRDPAGWRATQPAEPVVGRRKNWITDWFRSRKLRSCYMGAPRRHGHRPLPLWRAELCDASVIDHCRSGGRSSATPRSSTVAALEGGAPRRLGFPSACGVRLADLRPRARGTRPSNRRSWNSLLQQRLRATRPSPAVASVPGRFLGHRQRRACRRPCHTSPRSGPKGW